MVFFNEKRLKAQAMKERFFAAIWRPEYTVQRLTPEAADSLILLRLISSNIINIINIKVN